MGPNPQDWQIFGLVARWLMAVALWWVIRLTWQGHPRLAFTTALLALLYPGFSQHSIALVYGHYSLTFAMFFASLGLGIFAMRVERYHWLAIAGGVILSAMQLFSVEYYFGLELLRPDLMWVVAGETTHENLARFKNTLKSYFPFGLVLAGFGLWRSLGFKSEIYNLGERQAIISTVAGDAVQGIWNASVSAWGNLFHLPPAEMGTRLLVSYAGLLLAAAVGIATYIHKLQPMEGMGTPESNESPFRQWFAVGVIAILLAGIPFFIANLPIKLTFPSDRFTQPFALGTALIVAALIEIIPGQLAWRAGVTGLLAALAIGVQIQNGYAFREDWRSQQSYFWQLAWRAPGLKPGTVLVSDDSPFRFTDDDALTFGLNWMYDPESKSGNLKYGQVFLETRPGELLTARQPVEWRLTPANFLSTTDSMIVVQYNDASCLRVLNPKYDADLPLGPLSKRMSETLGDLGYPILRQGNGEALPLSNMDQVIPSPINPASPSEVIFGGEPPHQWCYYFEKADLARSAEDWMGVAKLGDEAFALQLHPRDLSEYLPFIEAYAYTGRMKEAKTITRETAAQMPVLKPALCALWQRAAASNEIPEPDRITATEIQRSLHYCPVDETND